MDNTVSEYDDFITKISKEIRLKYPNASEEWLLKQAMIDSGQYLTELIFGRIQDTIKTMQNNYLGSEKK